MKGNIIEDRLSGSFTDSLLGLPHVKGCGA